MINILPNARECGQNKNNFLTYLSEHKKNRFPTPNELSEAIDFYKNLNVYHQFTLDIKSFYQYIDDIEDGILPEPLNKNSLLSNSSLLASNVSVLQRTHDNDRLVGLDKYVFFSYAHPFALPKGRSILFVFSLKDLINNYSYPHTWFSWGDIITYAEQLYGSVWSSLSHEQVYNVSKLYSKHIFLLADLPEIVAHYSLLMHNNLMEPITSRWGRKYFGYNGPEIKVLDSIPINYATRCIVDNEQLPIAKLAYLLYDKGILLQKPDSFTHLLQTNDPILRFFKRGK